MNKTKSTKKVSTSQGLLLLALVAGLIIAFARVNANSTVALGLTWVVIYLACVIWKFDWNDVVGAAYDANRKCFGSTMILFCVGALVGTWIAGGTIPTMIYYGLSIINPNVFLLCALIITSIMSIFTGTSYGSAASAGVAMMGVGLSMGIPAGMIAGAILCGATFGDKLSPLSDTTNICPALVGGTLWKHIGTQLYTTVPAYIVCIIVFGLLGAKYTGDASSLVMVHETMSICDEYFVISPICLLPMLLVVALLLLKVDTLPAIMLGSLGGAALSIFVQGRGFVETMGYMWSGFSIDSGNAIVDKLMNRGGFSSMASAVLLMIFAIGMGAMLEHMGVMDIFMAAIIKRIKSVFSLIASTMLVSYVAGALTCTMTSANVVTGKLMGPLFKEKGVAPEVCSRTMEDTGTIGGPLMPWHANVAYYGGVLSVTWGEFIPYLVLSYTVPVFALICAATGIGVFYVNHDGERISKEEWKKLYNQE